jgi:hypothetical protein
MKKVEQINIDIEKKETKRRITNIFLGNHDPRVLVSKIKIFQGEYCKTFFILPDNKSTRNSLEPSMLRSSSNTKNKPLSSSRILNRDRNMSSNSKNINDGTPKVKPFEERRSSVKSKCSMPIMMNNFKKHLDFNDKNESIMILKKKFGLKKEKLPKINSGVTQYFNDTDFYYK